MTLYAFRNPRVAFPALEAGAVCSGGMFSRIRAFAAVVCSGRVVSLMIARLLEYPKSLN